MKIAKYKPFDCTLVLIKQKNKGRHAKNVDGSAKKSKHSLKHANGANDPWLLATNIPTHRTLSKQVVGIYRQRMQIEEGFRDMKSTQYGLGFEQNKSTTTSRLTILVLLTTLASVALILSGMVLFVSGKTKRFKANTETRQTLSFHTLGRRAWVTKTRFTLSQWQRTINWLDELVDNAWPHWVLS